MASKFKSNSDLPEEVTVGKTRGSVQQVYGENPHLKAMIFVPIESAPEIPELRVTEQVNWKYLDTRIQIDGKTAVYSFEVEKENADKLQSIVWFFDTMYGC